VRVQLSPRVKWSLSQTKTKSITKIPKNLYRIPVPNLNEIGPVYFGGVTSGWMDGHDEGNGWRYEAFRDN